MKHLEPASAALLKDQQGVIASWQMLPRERRAASALVRAGLWQRITTRVFLASPASATPEQRAWASVLHGGPAAHLGGRNALILHGWDNTLGAPYHVVVPTYRKPTSTPKWIKTHRVAIGSATTGSLPRVGAHDAAAQAAAWARTDREALYILISALQQAVITTRRLIPLVTDRIRLRRRRLMLSAADAFAGGSQSLNELDLGAICRKHGLPQPIRQVKVFDGQGRPRSIDAEFEGTDGRTARAEIEGLHHLSPEVWFADQKRHNGLVRSGDGAYFRYNSWEIRYDPRDFVKDMRAALFGE